MQTQTDIHFEFDVPVSAELAYSAIARPQEWWIRDIAGETAAPGGSFNVRFGGENSFVKFTVTDAQPVRRYVWHADDCFLPWFEDKTEWNGTDVIFDITPTAAGCSVSMVHRGLTPEVACYNACTAGWEKHFVTGLQKLITDGVGMAQ